MGNVTSKGSRLQAGGSGAFSDNDCFENRNRRLAPDRSVVDKIERCCCFDCCESLSSVAGSSSLSPRRREFRISSD